MRPERATPSFERRPRNGAFAPESALHPSRTGGFRNGARAPPHRIPDFQVSPFVDPSGTVQSHASSLPLPTGQRPSAWPDGDASLDFLNIILHFEMLRPKSFAKRLPACTAARFHARLLRSSPPKTDHPPQISRSKLKRERANASTPSAMSP